MLHRQLDVPLSYTTLSASNKMSIAAITLSTVNPMKTVGRTIDDSNRTVDSPDESYDSSLLDISCHRMPKNFFKVKTIREPSMYNSDPSLLDNSCHGMLRRFLPVKRDDDSLMNIDDSTRSSFLDNSCSSTKSCSSMKSCLTVKTNRESLNSYLSSHSRRSPPLHKNVRFHTVEFREYPIILCDNPSASGPPIGLGWRYNPKDTLRAEIDAYESHRDLNDQDRRCKNQLRIPSDKREDILLDVGYSRSEIRLVVQTSATEKEKQRVKLLRKQRIEPFLKGVNNIKLGLRRSNSASSLRQIEDDCDSQVHHKSMPFLR